MEKKRFLDFLDMFDGGGAGQMGDKFEGGGLLSALGNAIGSPYGSEDPERRAARQEFYGSDQIGGAPMTSAPPPQVMPAPPTETERVGLNPPAPYSPPAQSPLERFGGMAPASYSPPAQSPMEMFGGQPPAAYTAPPPVADAQPQQYSASGMNPANVYDGNRERFARQLVEMLGPDAAQNLMSSGMGAQAYKAFVENGYNMPNY